MNQNFFNDLVEEIGIEGLIEDYKMRGIDISQSDIDNLRAFERELETR